MALGNRINRVIKANVNSAIGFNKLEGGAYVTGGAVTGVAAHGLIGNAGIVACGTGVGVYVGHFVAAGAVVGAAAYGVKKMCE